LKCTTREKEKHWQSQTTIKPAAGEILNMRIPPMGTITTLQGRLLPL